MASVPAKSIEDGLQKLLFGLDGIIFGKSSIEDSIFKLKSGLSDLCVIKGFSDGIKSILTEINAKFLCMACQNKFPTILLRCGHCFCSKCLIQNSEDLLGQTVLPLFYQCPYCTYQISAIDLEKTAPNEWNTIISDISTMRKQALDSECFSCSKQKPKKSFIDPICSYHEYCKECIGKNYRNNIYKCSECNNPGKGEPIKDMGLCNACNELVYYVGDYLTSICREHTHCFNCLGLAKENQRCGACALKLTAEDLWKIEETLFGKCGKCGDLLERALMIDKYCCDVMVCVKCQFADDFKCINCGSGLNGYSLQMVQEFKAALG